VRNPAIQGRRDANHADITIWYQQLFCNVIDYSHVGFGHPDLGIACSGRLELAEVKTEDGELNAAQKLFAAVWRGPKIPIIRTREDVINHVQDIRRRVARVSRNEL
jgi:hypothetical protein